MISEKSLLAVNEVALWLHAQTDIRTLQQGLLERLCELIPHRASFFDLCCARDGTMLFFNPISLRIDDDALSEYYQRYEVADYTRWCFDSAAPVVYRDSEMISDAAREQSLIYREWMRPQGLYYSMGCTTVAGGVPYGSTTLFRSREDGDFTEEDKRVMQLVNEHLGVHLALLMPRGFPFRDGPDRMTEFARAHGLTRREGEAMGLAAEGKTNREIAQALYISESTVKKHLNAIFRKLGIENRVQLMRTVYDETREAETR